MESLSEIATTLSAMAPVAQEFYLFCFFCLGFVLFRTEAMKRRLSWSVHSESKAKVASLSGRVPQKAHSEDSLRSDFRRRQYEEVLEGWKHLEQKSIEALVMVVTSLLALGRPEDVGLVSAKAVANASELRKRLHEVVTAVASPSIEVPRQRVASALRDIHQQARDSLDARGKEALLVALARLNDEQRVGALLRDLAEMGSPASSAALSLASQGFLGCKNLDAAFGYLNQLFQSGAEARSTRELATAAARAAAEEAASEEGVLARGGSRARTWDLLELLESAPNAPPEALVVLLEWSSRQSPVAVEMAGRVESRLRMATGSGAIPAAASDALVRVHASAFGDQSKAFRHFDELAGRAGSARGLSEGSLVGMISSCVEAKNADLAQHILAWTRKSGRCTLPVLSATIKVLATARLPERICEVFEAVSAEGLEPDDVVYGQIIKFAVQAGQLDMARQLFKRARNPDAQNCMSLIRACGQEGDVPGALATLWELAGRGVADTAAYNCALDVCVSHGHRSGAREVFQAMKASAHVDVVSYNILLKTHLGEDGSLEEVESLLQEMHDGGFRPNIATYNSVLGGALAAGDFARAWRTIGLMEAAGGPGLDAYTISILFKGYKGRRRSMDAQCFDRALHLIKQFSVKVDEILVNVVLEACVALKDPSRLNFALSTFRRSGWVMPKQCAMHTYATMIKAYGQSHQLNMAWKLWEDVTVTKGLIPSEQLYGQMIDVLVTSGCLEDALALFQEMKATHADHMGSQGFAVAYAMIIKGFAQRKECVRALKCYEEMKQHGARVGIVVFNSLIDACSRVGDMDAAAGLFRDMVGVECVPDLITYSTLIKGYCIRGELDQAMELFALMRKRGIKPDAIVFNSLLDGCAKKTMPVLCEQVVNDMVEAGVAPSNYSASILIKLYGRCSDLDAAFKVIDEMPRRFGFRPNTAVYTCLMSACIANGRLDLALELRHRMNKEGIHLDEKTYSTLLRGALRAGSMESCVALIGAALSHRPGRDNLDEELVQSVLVLVQRKRAWDEHGRPLLAQLQEVGLAKRCPQDGPSASPKQGPAATSGGLQGSRAPRRPSYRGGQHGRSFGQ